MSIRKDFELGTWIQINSPTVVEIMGMNGFDFVVIDLEHGNISLENLEHLLRAAKVANLKSIVRVYENNAALIMKVLDLGPDGLLVPQVSSKAEALKVVKHAKYPPFGDRGSCPCIRQAKHWETNWTEFMEESNKQTMLIALVEGKEGVENFSEIAEVEGIDALMIGPFDLSVSLGIPGQIKHPMIEEKYAEIIQVAKSKGKDIIGVDFSFETDDIESSIETWKSRGVHMIMTGIDKMFLTKIVREITQLRGNVK